MDQRPGWRSPDGRGRARRVAHSHPRARSHRVHRWWALTNAATLAVLALGPLRPAVYFAGTVLFLFTVGAGYALFTGVVLEFLGGSGKSGSSRYAIINSLGNVPVVYMTDLDGRGYAHWGPRGMPAADAVLTTAGCLLLLAHFIVSRRHRQAKLSARAVGL